MDNCEKSNGEWNKTGKFPDDYEEKLAEWKGKDIVYHPIGIVRSEHTIQDNTPIQGVFNDSVGEIVLYDEYVPGLQNIENFSHLILLYHFDRATGVQLVREPFLDGGNAKGIFAIRHFNRPNPIGFSIVTLLGRDEKRKNVLKIGAVDILNGTPVIDIKPYVYKFDHRDEVTVKNGWVEDKHLDDIFNWNATPKGLRDTERTHK